MAERLPQAETPVIRFHHIGLWDEFVEKYTEALGGIYPWDLSGENYRKAESFIFDHVRACANTEVHAREYFEELSLTGGRSSREDLEYLYDIIGSTQADFDEVLEKRTKAFTKIFAAVSNNKNNLIILNTEPDDICGSCAIGLHCNRTFIQKVIRSDRDFIYMRIMQKLINRYGLGGPLDRGGVGRLGKDEMYISGETLFNREFHRLVSSEIIKVYKEAWMLHY